MLYDSKKGYKKPNLVQKSCVIKLQNYNEIIILSIT